MWEKTYIQMIKEEETDTTPVQYSHVTFSPFAHIGGSQVPNNFRLLWLLWLLLSRAIRGCTCNSLSGTGPCYRLDHLRGSQDIISNGRRVHYGSRDLSDDHLLSLGSHDDFLVVSGGAVGRLLLEDDYGFGAGPLLLGCLSHEDRLGLSVYDRCLRLGHHVSTLGAAGLQHVLAGLRTGHDLHLALEALGQQELAGIGLLQHDRSLMAARVLDDDSLPGLSF